MFTTQYVHYALTKQHQLCNSQGIWTSIGTGQPIAFLQIVDEWLPGCVDLKVWIWTVAYGATVVRRQYFSVTVSPTNFVEKPFCLHA